MKLVGLSAWMVTLIPGCLSQTRRRVQLRETGLSTLLPRTVTGGDSWPSRATSERAILLVLREYCNTCFVTRSLPYVDPLPPSRCVIKRGRFTHHHAVCAPAHVGLCTFLAVHMLALAPARTVWHLLDVPAPACLCHIS